MKKSPFLLSWFDLALVFNINRSHAVTPAKTVGSHVGAPQGPVHLSPRFFESCVLKKSKRGSWGSRAASRTRSRLRPAVRITHSPSLGRIYKRCPEFFYPRLVKNLRGRWKDFSPQTRSRHPSALCGSDAQGSVCAGRVQRRKQHTEAWPPPQSKLMVCQFASGGKG